MRYLDDFETCSRTIFLTCHHINKLNCLQIRSEVSPTFMTVTGVLNNVFDNFSALFLSKRLTSLFLSRKPVSGRPSRKQETISMQGVTPLEGSCGGKVSLWHLSGWKEDIINIKLGLLNDPLQSYYIYTFISRNGLLLAFGWWLTSRTFASLVFTTFTLMWKKKLPFYLVTNSSASIRRIVNSWVLCSPSSYKN